QQKLCGVGLVMLPFLFFKAECTPVQVRDEERDKLDILKRLKIEFVLLYCQVAEGNWGWSCSVMDLWTIDDSESDLGHISHASGHPLNTA
ncbi:uncharacterized protein B0I36DRAFT_339910, partial [Microdochium trichocladiopsis]